jgi:serine/threonine protein kinase
VKTCPTCHRLYEASSGFCPVDGQKLDDADPNHPPKSADDPRVGSRLCDRYVIYRVIADGGMGRVYQALDTASSRGVAMKILHAEVAADSVQVERFRREFEVSAKLPHDYIVEVLAFEKTHDGTYALVMEYLEGEELRMVLKREKTIRPERIVRMVSQVALGLEKAHEEHQVHRDLKPDNVFLCHTPEGDVAKILDFGSVRDNSQNAKKLTVMGTTIGSPFYMSPEQAQGLPGLDHRADVWSMAAIVYEAIAGRVPFAASSGPAILLAILSDDPPMLSDVVGPATPAALLDDVMELALAKSPDHRPATMGALADAVGTALGLEGNHREWAKLPEAVLGEQIGASIERKLAERAAAHANKVDTSALDAAFKEASSAELPDDYVVLGLPQRPAWFWPAVVGGVLAAVAAILFVVTR